METPRVRINLTGGQPTKNVALTDAQIMYMHIMIRQVKQGIGEQMSDEKIHTHINMLNEIDEALQRAK